MTEKTACFLAVSCVTFHNVRYGHLTNQEVDVVGLI
jgi:hypothetical protein